MRMKVAAVFILHRQIVILYFQHSRHKVCSTSSIYSESTYPGAYCAPLRPLADPSARKWVILNVTRYYALILQKLHGFSSTTPKMPSNGIRNSSTGLSIPIRIHRMCHSGISLSPLKQLLGESDDGFRLHTGQLLRCLRRWPLGVPSPGASPAPACPARGPPPEVRRSPSAPGKTGP